MLADGTEVSALAKLVSHLGQGKDGVANHKITLHTHFERFDKLTAGCSRTSRCTWT